MKRTAKDNLTGKSFVIPIRVSNESVLYDTFDPSGKKLSEELNTYLMDMLEDRRMGESVCLELVGNRSVNIERFRHSYTQYIDELIQRNKKERLRQSANALRLLLIGIVFVMIGLIFARSMGEVTAAIVSTIGSFAIWEASAIWIEKMPLLTARDRQLAALADAEIRYCQEDQNEET